MNDLDRCPSEHPPVSEPDPLELGGPSDELLFAYLASMPMTYRRLFDEDAQHEHAAIAYRRHASATHIEIWRKLPERIVAVALVADDRPGLLSRVSAALVAHDMDVVAAQAYGRKRLDDGASRRSISSGSGAPRGPSGGAAARSARATWRTWGRRSTRSCAGGRPSRGR